MIRVLLAEDEQLLRDALTTLLNLEHDIRVVAGTGRGDEVTELVREHRCEVAVLDIDMPGADGITAAQRLTDLADVNCAVVILTTYGKPGYLRRAVQAGVRGFVTKDIEGNRLAEVIREIHKGGRYIDPEIAADALLAGECPLGSRELQILRLAESGRPLAEIAREVSLSEGTVRNYISGAVAKLGVPNRTAAVQFSRRMGWL
jgi:two-component system response regulator DesR